MRLVFSGLSISQILVLKLDNSDFINKTLDFSTCRLVAQELFLSYVLKVVINWKKQMSTVAVLGGGIAGLSSAYFLSRLPLTNISKVESFNFTDRCTTVYKFDS